jgi:ABC-type multidrug transport system fused ATPase/permease subunit
VTDATRNQRETLSSLYARLQERISGVRTIRIFAREQEESRLFGMDLRALYDKNVPLIRSWSRFGMRSYWITAAANACILCIGGIVVAHGGFSIGNLVSFSLYAGMLFGPLGQLVDSYAQLMTNGEVAMRRIFEVLDEPVGSEVSSGSEPCPALRGEIRLESVSFSNTPHRPVLRDVSIEIRPGERAAIVGPSGGGKSTLVNLICRFYSVDGGRILVDGADITRWDVKSWRRRISYVAQDSFIFSGTIMDNIRFGKPEATDAEVERAADHANALETIRAMPQGFTTIAGERGITLSGGQRQRIAIARALVLDPSIIIMDEPTSALDAESESILLEALDSVFKGRTCIVIAHRLSTVVNSDRIFVLSGGTIVQEGRHAELVAVPGIYRELCTRQFLTGGIRL